MRPPGEMLQGLRGDAGTGVQGPLSREAAFQETNTCAHFFRAPRLPHLLSSGIASRAREERLGSGEGLSAGAATEGFQLLEGSVPGGEPKRLGPQLTLDGNGAPL